MWEFLLGHRTGAKQLTSSNSNHPTVANDSLVDMKLVSATHGGPPFCDECPEGFTVSIDHCKAPSPGNTFVDVHLLKAKAVARARESVTSKMIDVDIEDNLNRAKVYTYAGTRDGSWGTTRDARDFFQLFYSN